MVPNVEIPESPPYWCIDTPFAGGCQFILTESEEVYRTWVAKGYRVFLLNEVLAMLDAGATRTDLEWALIVKRLRPGTKILDVKSRKTT